MSRNCVFYICFIYRSASLATVLIVFGVCNEKDYYFLFVLRNFLWEAIQVFSCWKFRQLFAANFFTLTENLWMIFEMTKLRYLLFFKWVYDLSGFSLLLNLLRRRLFMRSTKCLLSQIANLRDIGRHAKIEWRKFHHFLYWISF